MADPQHVPADGDRLSARLTGRVQGVGFRYHVRQHAKRLGVHGFVRNEHDGSVVVEAEAAAPVLDEFEAVLREGPPGARVAEARVERSKASGGFDGFDVRFG